MRVRLTGLVGLSLAVLLGLTSMPNVFAQEKAQKAEKAKKADKAQKAPEKANIQGTVQNISKETSTLTVRVGSGTTATRMVVYSPSTKFLLGHSNDNKPGSAVEDNPGRRARHIDAVTRDGRQLNLGSRAGIEGRRIGAVIGYPPGRRSARDQSPGIDQRGIHQVGSARLIGYQIVLSVELGDGRICRAEHKSYP